MATPSLTRSQFVDKYLTVNGDPFSLAERPYLKDVYDHFAQKYVFMNGRQTEKSTTISIKDALYLLNHTNFSICYAAPSIRHASEFSKKKFIPTLRGFKAPFDKYFEPIKGENNVFEKTFPGERNIKFRHTSNSAENIRGISIDKLDFDEVQSMDADVFAIAKEALSHSKYKIESYSGTPLSTENPLATFWNRSTQCEWLVKCTHCNKYQLPLEKNITPQAIICIKCGKKLDTNNGLWVARNPKANMVGYHVPQTIVSWIDPAELFEKLEEYPRHQFLNEVLGVPAESSEKPFPRSMFVEPRMDPSLELFEAIEGTPWYRKPLYAGVDWGGGENGKTVFTIFGFNENDRLQLLYIKYFTRAEEKSLVHQTSFIAKKIRDWGIKLCVGDYGFGLDQGIKLRNKLGGRYLMCMYTNAQHSMKSRSIPYTIDHTSGIIKLNKSVLISDVKYSFQRCRIVFPNAYPEQLEKLISDMSNEYQEYRKQAGSERSETLYYDHPLGTTDDGLHSVCYAHLASIIDKTEAYTDLLTPLTPASSEDLFVS